MAEYLIQKTTLTSIADAIREKTGTTGTIKPTDMASKIGEISVGGDFDTTDENTKNYLYQLDSQRNITLFMPMSTLNINVNIPNQIGGYNTVINSLGTNNNGFFLAIPSVSSVTFDKNVRFVNNSMAKMFRYSNINCNISIPSHVTNISYLLDCCNNFTKNIAFEENSRLINASYMFNCARRFGSIINLPDSVQDTSGMFNSCNIYNKPIVLPSSVVNTSNMFSGCNNFNQPIVLPNSITNASRMFAACNKFNQAITLPSMLTDGNSMFSGCNNFNQPIKLPQGLQMANSMFSSCNNFNQPITIPNSVLRGEYMFQFCNKFNQPITLPDGINCYGMFNNCVNFNSPVIFSGTSNNAGYLFGNCQKFNQSVTFNGSLGSTMNMFKNCRIFNKPIIGNITTLSAPDMFSNCVQFNQPVTFIGFNLRYAFYNCTNMSQNITLLSNGLSGYNLCGFLQGKNNSKRINIFLKPNSYMNTYCAWTNTYSIFGASVTWTQDPDNSCYYNTARNVYVYYTVTD